MSKHEPQSNSSYAEQVIIQVCVSPHFGVICERLLTADETIPFIACTFARRRLCCKAYSRVFRVAAPRPLFQNRQQDVAAAGSRRILSAAKTAPTAVGGYLNMKYPGQERGVSAIDVAVQQVLDLDCP
jgi:hypothetical protein